jgi:hydrophobic/amphiphilic exporter-1 (mainly G- bacteria), HAE1 family
MGLIEFSLKRRVTVSMFAVALVIFGFVSFTRLPINLLPDITYPTLTVETKYPGAAPGEVETLVTRPIEEVVGIISGVKRLTSVSRPGLSQVTLEFEWGRNMDFAALDVRQKLELITLPRETEKPVLLRFDPANDPIVRLYLTGGQSLYQLRYTAEEVLKKDLESTEGVAAIKINGGYEEEIQVRVDEQKLSLLGLTMEDVNQKLRRENVNQAGGSLYEKEARYLVRARNEFQDLEGIMATVLISREGRNITMADVAEVERTHKQRDVITRYRGREAVELALYKEGDANTVQVARSIKQRLDRVKKELPAGLEVVTAADQSQFIEKSIDEVIGNAAKGGAIAIFVLLFFLKDLRSTLIIALTIPISIIATFFLMYQFGTSLNVMSLGGLALGVGMLVDGAIVVLESIHKRREKGERGIMAAQRGAKEVSMAVVASILTTVVVFVPVVFVEGIAAQLFRDQAITVSISLIASLVISLTLIPLLSAITDMHKEPIQDGRPYPADGRWYRKALWHTFRGGPLLIVRGVRRGVRWAYRWIVTAVRPLGNAFDRALGSLTRAYPGALEWALRSKAAVIAVALTLFVLSLFLIPVLGIDLIPTFSQGEFSFSIVLPEGTPLEMTDGYVQNAQSVLEGDETIASYSSTIGGAGLSLSSTGTEGENSARIFVRMKEGTRAAEETVVIEKMRSRLEALGQSRFKFERPSYFTFRTPIEVDIYGDSLEQLQQASIAVKERMESIRGLADVKATLEFANPELQVSFSREQLAQLGLDLAQVATTVRNKVQGEIATDFLEADREIEIRVRSIDPAAASVDDVANLIIAQRDGVPIYLKSVADVKVTEGPTEIRRIAQKRAVVVAGNLNGRSMGDVAADVREVIRTAPFPGGITASLSGQEEEMQRSFRSLALAGALALFLVYLVMACQFESLLHPFVVMFTVPLGVVGMLGALAITGNTINIVAIIGAVMLAGIVVNNAIVLIDGVNQLRERGVPKEKALVEAGLNRLRPILMTSACTVLGLVPMAIGLGEGAELQRPLAITVIGGLTLGTVLTLIVIPVVYTLLDRKVYAADASSAPAEENGEWPVGAAPEALS